MPLNPGSWMTANDVPGTGLYWIKRPDAGFRRTYGGEVMRVYKPSSFLQVFDTGSHYYFCGDQLDGWLFCGPLEPPP